MTKLLLEPLVLHGEGEYNLNIVKEEKGTDSFLAMSSDVTKCQEIIEYQDCTTKVYEDAMKKNCRCLPFHLRMTEFVMFLDKYD